MSRVQSAKGGSLDTEAVVDLDGIGAEVDPDGREEQRHPEVHSHCERSKRASAGSLTSSQRRKRRTSDSEREDVAHVVDKVALDEDPRLVDRARERRLLGSRVEVVLADLLVRSNSRRRTLAPDLRKAVEVLNGREIRAGRVVELGVDDLNGVVGGV